MHDGGSGPGDNHLVETTRLQGQASDPTASVWVSANAGTGKTHVLTNRVLRLLLAGAPPEKILCLTYTKAAAAEMSTRVFARLAEWVTASDDALAQMLAELLERPASLDETQLARQLFTRSIETPGGLKVQTIHAFCERLLQRFPLEAGVPPGFAILDDSLGARIKRDAVNEVLDQATSLATSPLGEALRRVIAYAQEDRFDDVIGSVLSNSDWLDGIFDGSLPMDGDGPADEPHGLLTERAIEKFVAQLRVTFSLADDETEDRLMEVQGGVLSRAQCTQIAAAFAAGKKDDVTSANALRAAVASWDSVAQRVEAFEAAFLTKSGGRRARLFNKGLQDTEPGLCDALDNAQAAFVVAQDGIKAIRAIEATAALMRLADAVMRGYTDAKARRAVLDYDDLILKTSQLLATSDQASWVLYKLDGGLDHILVDESQDTAPQQWQIIEGLAREFFSGDGARDEARTLFAVGDEKQSIYSFQGAAPEMFARMGLAFSEAAHAAGRVWRDVTLTLSFRTAEAVLMAVDATFKNRDVTPGLTSDPSVQIAHLVKRVGQAGLVEVWPTEKPSEKIQSSPWDPFGDEPQDDPAVRLAEKIADTIHDWIANGEILASQNRPVRPSDVLILVRKRTQFANPMVAALKARGIPVAGSDRMDLTDQLVVQDLMALGDFLVLPEDDLALACVLKSPLFGFDDDDLFEIGHITGKTARKGSLWRALLAQRAARDHYGLAVDQLIAWRKRADFWPPFEFFSEVLDRDGGRRRLLDRLGLEAADPLDEFLNAAIQFDEGEAPSLQGFMTWLRSDRRQIKRDMEQGTDEVRVLTVHGAKGLEAPIVFLPDTCSTRGAGGASSTLIDLGPNRGELIDGGNENDQLNEGGEGRIIQAVWAVAGSKDLAPIQAAKSAQAAREAEERNRLLYVAMTRARDRLYVCGFESSTKPPPDCWYHLISNAIANDAQAVSLADGREVVRVTNPQTEPPDGKPVVVSEAADAATARPEWAMRPAPKVIAPSVPIAPSRLAPYDYDHEGEPVRPPAAREAETRQTQEPAAPSPISEAERGTSRFLRGNLTHGLLQYLPDIPAAQRPDAAQAYVDQAGAALPASVKRSVTLEAMRILDDDAFAHLFGPGSRAEATLSAEIQHPSGNAPPLTLHGQIDRLVVSEHTVAIVDFKSNRSVAMSVETIPEAYVLQLAAYRLALKQLYPDRAVEAYLLWTANAQMMRIPEDVLEARTSTLWDIKTRPLDAEGQRS
ncbi:MAG: double-strand break repair helicase AddA [Pseudomonadota bacterium]